MTRSQDRQRKQEKGIPVANFKSKTCPSAVKARQLCDEEYSIGRILPRRHTGRTKLKASLAARYGLPKDAKFIFRRSSKSRPEGAYLENLKLNFGTSVVINKEDASLVLAVRCNEFRKMTREEKEGFRDAISTPYLHARARITCTLHSSIQTFILACIIWGWMVCCGWRGGSDAGKSIGTYSLNDFASKDRQSIEDDRERMTRFHKIRDFWAEHFSTLSLSVFESNLKLAKTANIPGFHQVDWQHTANGKVFASNLVVTADGFRNSNHTDDYDHTRYSYGMFCLIDRATGEPYQIEGSEPRGNVLEAAFVVKEFGVQVDFSGCDGIVEMIWDTRIKHQSTPSKAFTGKGKRIRHIEGKVTRFGSSCQISESVVDRIRMFEREKKNMSEQDWLSFVKARVKSYEEETQGKLENIDSLEAPGDRRKQSLHEEKLKVLSKMKTRAPKGFSEPELSH